MSIWKKRRLSFHSSFHPCFRRVQSSHNRSDRQIIRMHLQQSPGTRQHFPSKRRFNTSIRHRPCPRPDDLRHRFRLWFTCLVRCMQIIRLRFPFIRRCRTGVHRRRSHFLEIWATYSHCNIQITVSYRPKWPMNLPSQEAGDVRTGEGRCGGAWRRCVGAGGERGGEAAREADDGGAESPRWDFIRRGEKRTVWLSEGARRRCPAEQTTGWTILRHVRQCGVTKIYLSFNLHWELFTDSHTYFYLCDTTLQAHCFFFSNSVHKCFLEFIFHVET